MFSLSCVHLCTFSSPFHTQKVDSANLQLSFGFRDTLRSTLFFLPLSAVYLCYFVQLIFKPALEDDHYFFYCCFFWQSSDECVCVAIDD